ncbi:MAG: hypothetical protein K6G10_06865 [Butyrivibrio sp.]|nr:hypothetical protein [Butyrivibrio sp.]
MAKYIDRNKLPQFLYYNSCCGKYNGWYFRNNEDATAYYEEKSNKKGGFSPSVAMTCDFKAGELDFEKAVHDRDNLLQSKDDENLVTELYDEWIAGCVKGSHSYNLMTFAMFAVRAMHADREFALQWEERLKKTLIDVQQAKQEDRRAKLLLHLSLLEEYLSIAVLLRTAQGFPLPYTDGDRAYPKMLLIEDELYKKYKGNKNIELNFKFLKKAVKDTAWVITVNGDSAEKKMVFIIADAGAPIVACMIDPRNGLSRYFVQDLNARLNEDSVAAKWIASNPSDSADITTFITGDAWFCHPRGDYWCNGKENICSYVNGTHNCMHKSLDIISAILYCLQEYYIKVINEKSETPQSKSSVNSASKQHAETFIPDGMMRLYDIKMSKEELARFNKFALYSKNRSAYPSTEKCPHTRRATMRYNPKTGQRDIRVKGSIIHKEKYQGFASAERIVE